MDAERRQVTMEHREVIMAEQTIELIPGTDTDAEETIGKIFT